MEDRETARMRKYGESKTTRIMMATVPQVTFGLGLRKFQADGFLLTRVYENDEIFWNSLNLVEIMHDGDLRCNNWQFKVRITNTSRDDGLFYLHQHFDPNITFFS